MRPVLQQPILEEWLVSNILFKQYKYRETHM